MTVLTTLPAVTRVQDGLVNVAGNLGTARDKAAYSQYVYAPPTYQQLAAAYESAWLPRAIVDIPAADATRKWRTWKAETEQITKIEDVEKRLGVKRAVKEALTWARLFGGAAIYINTGDAASDKPLDPKRNRPVRSLPVLTCYQLRAEQAVKDINSPYFGKPEFYVLTGEGGAQVRIHASRLVVLKGAASPNATLGTGYRQGPLDGAAAMGWGSSVLASVMDAVTAADSSLANVTSLIFEAKVDVFQFQGLADQFQSAGGDGLVTKRLMAQALMKSINGAVVLDAEDTYEQKNASFGGLAEIIDRILRNACGAARIPETRLFGRASAGLSGSGDGDERVYYDSIGDIQTDDIQPALSVLDECIIWNALGSRPPEIWYDWTPLRQLTEKERADILKTTADAARALAGAQAGELIPVDALSDALVNEIVELGVLPGLEQGIAEYGSLSEQNELEPEPLPATVPAIPAPVGDAAPRTLYVSRKVVNAPTILKWAREQGFKNLLKPGDLHVTIAYSRTPVDWMAAGSSWQSRLEVPEGGPRLMEQFGEARVLLFTASELVWRHEDIKRAGATFTHEEYQPHITLSYDPDSPDLSTVEPYQGKIVLGPEIFAEVDENWREKVTS